jgi:hypothetical protein
MRERTGEAFLVLGIGVKNIPSGGILHLQVDIVKNVSFIEKILFETVYSQAGRPACL